jgi:HEAT repeat protein
MRSQEPLIHELQYDSSPIQLFAVRALGNLPSDRSVTALIDVFRRAKDRSVRLESCGSLGKLRAAQAVQPLAEALTSDDKELRTCVFSALGAIGNYQSAEVLLSAMRSKGWGDDEAGRALENVRDPQAKVLVIRSLSEPFIRGFAVQALANLHRMGARDVLPEMLRLANSSNLEERKSAAAALGLLGEDDARERLVTMLQKEGNEEVRAASVLALGSYVKSEMVLTIVLRALKDLSPQVRRSAIWALEKANESRVADPVIAAAGDPDEGVRREASNWLRSRTSKNDDFVIGLAVAALSRRDEVLRSNLIEPLSKASRKSVAEAIAQVGLEDRNADVREAISRVLRIMDFRESAAALIDEATKVGNISTRTNAIWLSGSLRLDKALLEVTRATSDPDPNLRSNAVWSLGEIRNDQSIDLLISAMSDGSMPVRREAAIALGKFYSNARAAAPLIVLLSSRDPGERERAASALAYTEVPEAESALVNAARANDISVAAGAYRHYITRGVDAAVPVIARMFRIRASKSLAEDLLNCGNPTLEELASEWASQNGYIRMSSFDGPAGPKWPH